MATQYVALLADAARSRDLPGARRAALQTDLRAAARAFTRRWKPVIAAGFALTRGDEIEVLLTTPRAVWDIAHHVRRAFPAVDWVLACGFGPIATPLAPTAPEVDGPCFHAARAALEEAKRRRLVFAFQGFAQDADLNGFAAYYSALYWTWTDRQRRLAHELRSPGGPPPPAPGRAPSALSHMRRRMAWPLVAAGDRIFQTLLEAS
jgi:hypothetical protein